MPVTPALWRRRREDCLKFEANLSYRVKFQANQRYIRRQTNLQRKVVLVMGTQYSWELLAYSYLVLNSPNIPELFHTRAHARACARFHIQKCHCCSQFGKKHIRCGGDKKRNVTGEVGQKGRSFSCLHGNGPGRSGTDQSGQEKLRGCRDSLAGSQESRAPPHGRISSPEPGLQAEAGSGWFPSSRMAS